MTPAEKAHLLQRLRATERLARGSKWRRLQRRPLRYLSATLYHRYLYPRRPRGWRRTAMTFFEQPMSLLLPAGTDIFLTGGKSHDSEIRLCRLFIDRLQPGDTFVDVGAHFGFYSLLAARLVGPGGRVLALEAAPASYQVLADNLQQAASATPLHLAAADHDGQVSFYEFPPMYSEYNSLDIDQFEKAPWRQWQAPRKLVVPGRRLDRLLEAEQLTPACIKIDVEGSEDRVIRGLATHLAVARPLIVMEYLAPEKHNLPHREAAGSLQAAGYRAHRIDTGGRLHPCPNIETYLLRQGLDSDNIAFVKVTHPC